MMGVAFPPLTRLGWQIDVMQSRMSLVVLTQSGLGWSMDSLAEDSTSSLYMVATKKIMYIPASCLRSLMS
jgi:hypothetical protein